MKLNNGLIHYKSKQAYQDRNGTQLLKKFRNSDNISHLQSVKASENTTPAENLKPADEIKQSSEISDQSKKLQSSDVKEKAKLDVKKVKSAAKHLLRDGAKVLKSALNTVEFPKVPVRLLKEVLPIQKTENMVNKEISKVIPSVFFISGLDLNLFNNDRRGLDELSKFTKDSSHYSWSDEKNILEQVSKLPKTKPLMLIGHSLGGDSAVSLANRLNTAEYGFRKVDLLITLDSIGFDNDLIPENVVLNHNYISDQDYFFNDGPNYARDYNKTQVENFLENKLHTEIDSDPAIQSQILDAIDHVHQRFVS